MTDHRLRGSASPVLTATHHSYKCKKHSLSHQLTAQLHMENSKNKKWR